jgi:hypothetical protein
MESAKIHNRLFIGRRSEIEEAKKKGRGFRKICKSSVLMLGRSDNTSHPKEL